MTSPTELPTEPDGPHKPAGDHEEVYFYGSPLLRWQLAHGWYWVLIGLVLIAAPILISSTQTASLPWWAFAAGVLLGLIFIFIPWILSSMIHYKISNYRIDVEYGLISKRYDTLELWHVEDIKMAQSMSDRILCVGTLHVYSHADRTLNSGELKMYGLPKPRWLFESVKQRIISVKRQRGVVKLDTFDADPGHHQQ